MIYLSGAVRQEFARCPDLGWMLTPMMGNRPDLEGSIWGADNGCFSAPHKFVLDEYLNWLGERSRWHERCLFATAPDVVGDAKATMAKSLPVLPQLREMGYRAALVAQDGLEDMEVPWDAFDCLFVGGSTAWKLGESAYRLAAEADRRGKWTHMGRVNSLRRLKACAVAGYDSADGTYVAFGPDINVLRVQAWMSTLRMQEAFSA